MKDLIDFALKEKYEKVKKLKSNLEEIKILVDWDSVAELIPKNKNLYFLFFSLDLRKS